MPDSRPAARPDPRPAARAAVTSAALSIVRAHAPDGVEVLELGNDSDLALDLSTVSFLVPPAGPSASLDALGDLPDGAIIQVLSAGTDWIEDAVPEHVTLCNARGARDAPVAEWLLGALLGASTGLLHAAHVSRWEDRELQDLGTATVLVVGMGSIGRRLADYLEPLGTTVVGVGSHAHDDVHGPEELPELLPRADALVVLAPLSEATRGLIGAQELAAMRDQALVINAARGAVVDADALLAETESGRLRAVLDVTDPEPLPDDHALWRAPGVLAITPHIAGDSPAGNRDAVILAGEQLERWANGEPLHNVVREAARTP